MTIDYTRVRAHRADSRATRAARRIGGIILILATIAIVQAITDHMPDVDSQQGPYIRTAAVGSDLNARTFDVDVLGVRGAGVISDDKGDHDTSGVWIIVKARFTALRNPVLIGYAVLVDGDGRTYEATARVDQSLLEGRELQPGLPVTAEIAFEVPVAVATDLSVEFAPSSLDQRMDVVAQVHLPIDRSEVTSWMKTAQPTTLATLTDGR